MRSDKSIIKGMRREHDRLIGIIRDRESKLTGLRSWMGLPEDDSMPVALGVGSGGGNLYVYGPYESIKVCQGKLLALADERARIDCATRGGWLSEDLECAGVDGPACWTHLLAEAHGKLDAVITEMLRRADCSDYEHKLHVPGRACSCGIDEALDRILKGGIDGKAR